MEPGTQFMSTQEYKAYHESFMENNHGSSAIHTFLCIFFTVQCSLLCSVANQHPSCYQIVFEYFVIILPLILAHTLLSEYIHILNLILFAILSIKAVAAYYKLNKTVNSKTNKPTKKTEIKSISFLRGLTYLITVFCILGVDFQSFPRNLSKTENYGYSLMDTGVGLFVLMSGLVHKSYGNDTKNMIKSNLKFVTVLLTLGIARFVSVKQLEYQEHVTEYGVHWNFFFTLAVCKVISSVILSYTSYPMLTSFVLLGAHECLMFIGLESWVFGDAPRTNIFNANREGLASSLGYVSLYLFAVHLKSILSNRNISRFDIQIKFVLLTVIMWTLALCVNVFRPTSRTLANAGYCLYLEAVLSTILTVVYCFEQSNNFTVPLILSAINYNGLVYFLVANLSTGAINLSIRTLFAKPFQTFIILNIYMIITVMFTLLLKNKGIKI